MRWMVRWIDARFLVRMVAMGGLAAALAVPAGWGAELPVGEPVERNGMQVMIAYLQPVEMAPATTGQEAAKADIHLEADIHALTENANGFPEDAWIPFLTVAYKLTKKGSGWTAAGTLLPMVANDGPHYGANVRLDGPGAYTVTLSISPPSLAGFLRHTDKETGVGPWWTPFEHTGEFKFVGTGKKGTY